MTHLRVLIVDDSDRDATLLLNELRKAGYSPVHQRVDAREGMALALAQQEWDVVICDHVMPGFSGPAALEAFREMGLDIPFIVVSGQIGEDAAVEAMRAGAHDYVMKGNLKRLVPVIERELAEAGSRKLRRSAEQELKRREEQLRTARETEKLKDEFIGMVSHELRTPLTVFLGAVRVARTPGITGEDIQELLKEAEQSAVSLGDILENLIELSRYQSNRLTLATEPLDIVSLVRECVETQKARLDNHVFALDIREGLAPAEAERTRIRQVLRNLLDNAAKYSAAGTEIRASVRQEGDNLVIGVSDNGRGISEANLETLFQPFQRLEGTSLVKGLGLGLLVCRRLVEAHGGRIWCESGPGQGAAFYFTLPLAPSRAQAVDIPASRRSSEAIPPVREPA